MFDDFPRDFSVPEPDSLPDMDFQVTEMPQYLDITPMGDQVLVIGDPQGDGQYNHLQGDNDLGFEGTCGLCSVQDVLNQHGIDVTENDLVHYAVDNGLCSVSYNPSDSGGTTPHSQTQLLNDFGIPAHTEYGQTLEALAANVESGHDVIIEGNAGVLFDSPSGVGYDPYSPNHAVVITGVARDPQTSEIVGFYVNDSGGFCNDGAGHIVSGAFVDARHMQAGWVDTGGVCVVTDTTANTSQWDGRTNYGNYDQLGTWHWSNGSPDPRYTWK